MSTSNNKENILNQNDQSAIYNSLTSKSLEEGVGGDSQVPTFTDPILNVRRALIGAKKRKNLNNFFKQENSCTSNTSTRQLWLPKLKEEHTSQHDASVNFLSSSTLSSHESYWSSNFHGGNIFLEVIPISQTTTNATYSSLATHKKKRLDLKPLKLVTNNFLEKCQISTNKEGMSASMNQSQSVVVKNVQQHHHNNHHHHHQRFINANVTQLNGNMFNITSANTHNGSAHNSNNSGNSVNSNSSNNLVSRKLAKSISVSNTLNSLPSAASSNQTITTNASSFPSSSSLSNTTNNNNNFSGSSSQSLPSSNIKNVIVNNNSSNSSIASCNNRKYALDYQQAIRFDYNDALSNNTSVDFLSRITQMQRLQIDTVEWERKKKQQTKKKVVSKNTNSNSNNNGSSGGGGGAD